MLELPEIPLDLEETETGLQVSLFKTNHTGLAAILYAIAEIRPIATSPIRGFAGPRGPYYVYYFQPDKIADHLARCYRHHRETIQRNPNHWFSRVLDCFHNQQRILELAHAVKVPDILLGHRRLRFNPILSGQTAGPTVRKIIASDGRVIVSDLKHLAILLSDDGVRLNRADPITINADVVRFNYLPGVAFTQTIGILNAPDRFVAANLEHWFGYALGSLRNYWELINDRLPLIPIQPKSEQTDDGNTQTCYLTPKEISHERN